MHYSLQPEAPIYLMRLCPVTAVLTKVVDQIKYGHHTWSYVKICIMHYPKTRSINTFYQIMPCYCSPNPGVTLS